MKRGNKDRLKAVLSTLLASALGAFVCMPAYAGGGYNALDFDEAPQVAAIGSDANDVSETVGIGSSEPVVTIPSDIVIDDSDDDAYASGDFADAEGDAVSGDDSETAENASADEDGAVLEAEEDEEAAKDEKETVAEKDHSPVARAWSSNSRARSASTNSLETIAKMPDISQASAYETMGEDSVVVPDGVEVHMTGGVLTAPIKVGAGVSWTLDIGELLAGKPTASSKTLAMSSDGAKSGYMFQMFSNSSLRIINGSVDASNCDSLFKTGDYKDSAKPKIFFAGSSLNCNTVCKNSADYYLFEIQGGTVNVSSLIYLNFGAQITIASGATMKCSGNASSISYPNIFDSEKNIGIVIYGGVLYIDGKYTYNGTAYAVKYRTDGTGGGFTVNNAVIDAPNGKVFMYYHRGGAKQICMDISSGAQFSDDSVRSVLGDTNLKADLGKWNLCADGKHHFTSIHVTEDGASIVAINGKTYRLNPLTGLFYSDEYYDSAPKSWIRFSAGDGYLKGHAPQPDPSEPAAQSFGPDLPPGFSSGDDSSDNQSQNGSYEAQAFDGPMYARSVYSKMDAQALDSLSSIDYSHFNSSAKGKLMPEVEYPDHDFQGWYDNPSFSGSPVTSIPDYFPPNGVVYYAQWVDAEGNVEEAVEPEPEPEPEPDPDEPTPANPSHTHPHVPGLIYREDPVEKVKPQEPVVSEEEVENDPVLPIVPGSDANPAQGVAVTVPVIPGRRQDSFEDINADEPDYAQLAETDAAIDAETGIDPEEDPQVDVVLTDGSVYDTQQSPFPIGNPLLTIGIPVAAASGVLLLSLFFWRRAVDAAAAMSQTTSFVHPTA